jgi:hypothetical protein
MTDADVFKTVEWCFDKNYSFPITVSYLKRKGASQESIVEAVVKLGGKLPDNDMAELRQRVKDLWEEQLVGTFPIEGRIQEDTAHAKEQQELKNLRELIPVAEACLDFIRPFAEPSPIYGGFHGGDPRDFTPDPEVTKPEELVAWRKACEEFAAGRTEPLPDQHEKAFNEKGEMVAHLARYDFGMGVTMLRDPDAEALMKRLLEAIKKAKGL